MNLAKMGMIAPLDLYRDLHMDNPQQRYDNWYKWKTAPDQLSRDAHDQSEDQEAYVDFVEIMAGKKIKPREEAGVAHILTHRKQMITDEFLKAKTSVQLAMLKHVEPELRSLELRTALDQMSNQGLEALNPANPIQPPMQPGMQSGAPMGPPGGPPLAGQMVPPMPGGPMGTPPAPGGAPPPSGQPPSNPQGLLGPPGAMPQGLPAPMATPQAPGGIDLTNPMNMGTP